MKVLYDDAVLVASSVPLSATGIITPLSDTRSPVELKQLESDAMRLLKSGDVSLDIADQVWFTSQVLKKWRGEVPSISPDQRSKEAIEGFLIRNKEAQDHHVPHFAIDQLRKIIERCLPPVDLDTCDGHFGPGAVAQHYSVIDRWESIPYWFYNPRTLKFRRESGVLQTPAPARLCAVPKTSWKDRLITIEPAELSFGQQYTRDLLMRSIHKGILRDTPSDFLADYDNVEKQRIRCVGASSSGTLATLDLSDASDSISWDQVLSIFPAWILSFLELFRSDKVHAGKDTHTLNIYAGMGNATTFLIETVYFFAIFTYFSRSLGITDRVTVFGDDVIVGTAAAAHPYLTEFLAKFGIRLNENKSCRAPGPGFRESCGIAAYKGSILTTVKHWRTGGTEVEDDIEIAGLATHYLNSSARTWCYSFGYSLLEYAKDIPIVHGESPSSDCNVIFTWLSEERGAPRVRVSKRYQVRQVYAKRSAGRICHHRYLHLSPWVAMGVIRGQLHVRLSWRHGRAYNIVEAPAKDSTRTINDWISYI